MSTQRCLFASVMALAFGLLAGCIQLPSHESPDLPVSPHTLSEPTALNGTWHAPLRDLARFGSIFFSADELYTLEATPEDPRLGYRFWPERFAIAVMGQSVVVTALGRDGRTLSHSTPVEWDKGSMVVKRRESGREGLAAATYSTTWRIVRTEGGELAVHQESWSVGIIFPLPVASGKREWICRLRRE